LKPRCQGVYPSLIHAISKLNLKVILWISDKQDAFLKCIAEEFSGVPHRYCENHFFRDLAKPVLDMDSTAKKTMRGKIRGLRALEREVLEARQADESPPPPSSDGRDKTSFQPGLFAGAEMTSHPRDNLDLERWFRCPKSHERRIHGHRHAGVRIVRDGPTLAPTLDAHAIHPGVFTRESLFPFRMASAPPSQLASLQRHGIMRKSRSKKNDSSC